jgi:hypothetical protein
VDVTGCLTLNAGRGRFLVAKYSSHHRSQFLAFAMFGGLITGASMNPARSIAPGLVSGNLHALWLYTIAPLLGASVVRSPTSSFAASRLIQPRLPSRSRRTVERRLPEADARMMLAKEQTPRGDGVPLDDL